MVQGVLEPEDVTQGIQSLSMDADIARIPYFTTRILNVSFRLQRNLGDFIDCLIQSTAINESDVLMTEDDILLNFTDDEANRAFLHALNPDFRILDHKQQESLGRS